MRRFIVGGLRDRGGDGQSFGCGKACLLRSRPGLVPGLDGFSMRAPYGYVSDRAYEERRGHGPDAGN